MEEAIRLLLTYGPGGVIAAILILGILVPRSFYDREVKRGDTATETSSKNADSLKVVADALTVVTATNVELTKEVKDLKEDVRDLREEVRLARLTGGQHVQ